MSEFVQSTELMIVIRVTVLLTIGGIAVRTFRSHSPSLAIAVARCLFIAVWLGPFVIMGGLTVSIPVLSNQPGPEILAEPQRLDRIASPVPRRSDAPDNSVSTLMRSAAAPSTAQESATDVTTVLPASEASSIARDIGSPKTFLPDRPVVAPQRVHAQTSLFALGNLRTLLLTVWGIVSGVLVVRFIARAVRTAGTVRRSTACDAHLSESLANVADRLRVSSTTSLRVSDEVTGPCTVGWLRTTVLLPKDWSLNNERDQEPSLSQRQLEMILGHELSHAVGRDTRWDAIAQLASALWWFHPLMHMLIRSHRLACEYRCDASASRVSGDTERYRRQLARWALAIRGIDGRSDGMSAASDSIASFSMAERPLMLQRLRWLKQGRIHDSTSKRRRLTIGVATALAAFTLLSIQLIQRSAAAPQAQTDLSSTQEDVGEASKSKATNDNANSKRVVSTSLDQIGYFTDQKPLFDWEKTVRVAITVMDQDDQPVSNALVQLSGIEDSQGRDGIIQLDGGARTDGRGSAFADLPGGVRSFRLTVSAPGYARLNHGMFNLSERVDVRLQKGAFVRVRAVNAQGDLLPNAMPMLEDSNIFGREFKNDGTGVHESPALAPDRRWMWVVDGSDASKPILFSDLLDVSDDSTADPSGIRNVVLSEGVRLEGTLATEVPRPVTNGFVHVSVRDGEGHRIEQFNRSGIVWHEYTQVNEDGSFVFTSLPRDTHVQLFAICDGWQSKSPTKDSVEEYFERHDAGTQKKIDSTMDRYNSNPQLFHLPSGQGPIRITVECRQTTSLDVRVVDPLGRPIANALVSMSPNLAFFGDLVIPGVQLWNHQLVRNSGVASIGMEDPFSKFAAQSFLDVPTDQDGIARVRNLPNTSDSFEVTADGYVMSAYPTTDAEKPGRYGLTGEMIPGKITRRTVTMERDLNPTTRELMVVDQDGKPLTDMELTITAIATNSDEPEWHQWSVRRFGEASSKRTGSDGLVKLLYPQVVDGEQVDLLSIRVEGRVNRFRFANRTIVLPAVADGSGFV